MTPEQYIAQEITSLKGDIKALSADLRLFSDRLIEMTTQNKAEKTVERVRALEDRVGVIEKFNVKLIAIWGTIQVLTAGGAVLVGWWLKQ